MNLLSVEVAEWLEHLGPHPGDRWFDSRRGLFAEKLDYFMIFGVYLRSMIERKAGMLLKDLNWC